jgi:hypothetical protein
MGSLGGLVMGSRLVFTNVGASGQSVAYFFFLPLAIFSAMNINVLRSPADMLAMACLSFRNRPAPGRCEAQSFKSSFGSVFCASPLPHKEVRTMASPKHAPAFPGFRLRELCDRSLRERCSSAANRFCVPCLPATCPCLRVVHEGGVRYPFVDSPLVGVGEMISLRASCCRKAGDAPS